MDRSASISSQQFARAAARRHVTAWRQIGLARRIATRWRCRQAQKTPALLKRCLDATLALPLLLLLSPVLATVATLCWLTTGRVLRARTVAGRRGRPATLFEFSLPSGRGSGLLRRLGVARLPWIWHVLRGDLSWIGPRPLPIGAPRPAGFQRRSCDRPGVVCLWWIRQRANVDYDTEWAADAEYVENVSLRQDLGIAARACWVRLLHPGRRIAKPRIEVLNTPIRNVSMDEAVNELHELLLTDGPPTQVAFVNADCVNLTCRNSDYANCLRTVNWNYADGIGMKWAACLQGASVRQNVNGTDLFPRLLAALEDSGQAVYLLGGEQGVSADVARWIQRRFPGAHVAGHEHGYFDEGSEQEVIERINRSGADLLLVAMGAPRQDLWIQRVLSQLEVRVAIGVGGLFDFYSGRKQRAPQWMREMGMEWAYRLWLEPRRLWRRYLVGNAVFLARVALHTLFRKQEKQP